MHIGKTYKVRSSFAMRLIAMQITVKGLLARQLTDSCKTVTGQLQDVPCCQSLLKVHDLSPSQVMMARPRVSLGTEFLSQQFQYHCSIILKSTSQ